MGLVFAGYARATSVMAHVHALQGISASSSAGEAAAACAEVDAAIVELAPLLFPLRAGRLVPLPTARAWGEVPRLVEAAQAACRSVQVYARVAPWPEATLAEGAAYETLTDIRRDRQLLSVAAGDLTQAWSLLAGVNLEALSAEPRLERPALAVSRLRTQEADVLDVLALATPQHAEPLLGGNGPVAVVLQVTEGGDTTQAYVVVEEGRAVATEVGAPPAPAAVTLTLDAIVLSKILTAVGDVPVPELGQRVAAEDLDGVLKQSPRGTAGAIARAVLVKLIEKKLADTVPALSALKQGADQHRVWLRFADPGLQALVVRHGWAPP